MKSNIKKFIFIFFIPVMFLLLVISTALAKTQDEDDAIQEENPRGIENNVFADENEACLKCHGEKTYTIADTLFGAEKQAIMCPGNRIERDEFYHSVHWSFACLDCHTEEFKDFPHPLQARFEEYWTCLDCHGFDDNFAQYHFEEIDEQHMESVHYQATEGDFSCWKCHDPHSYKILSRESDNVSEIIMESNNICLECHGNEEKFALLSSRELGNIVPEHDWLPNQGLHFKAVRCIECHSEMNDTLLVSHKVLPSSKAVKMCVDCHSRNSILMGTLYKFKAKQTRNALGFINGAIINNDAYVIGANRSRLLNIASLIIFGLCIGAIIVHVLFRISAKRR